MLIIGMLFGNIFQATCPSLRTEFENANLFRPWSDPLMLLYFVHPFLSGIILALVWNKTKVLFTGTSAIINGLCFGLIYWIFTIPGMIISYASFPVSFMMISDWTVSNLFEGLCVGILLSKTIKK
ncbi:MAG TPA: hypothetical protein VFJ43_05545, partial [Bacteroidia bacterium]|nr:hypothetical protein [Bacteroidia bacterium]